MVSEDRAQPSVRARIYTLISFSMIATLKHHYQRVYSTSSRNEIYGQEPRTFRRHFDTRGGTGETIGQVQKLKILLNIAAPS